MATSWRDSVLALEASAGCILVIFWLQTLKSKDSELGENSQEKEREAQIWVASAS